MSKQVDLEIFEQAASELKAIEDKLNAVMEDDTPVSKPALLRLSQFAPGVRNLRIQAERHARGERP